MAVTSTEEALAMPSPTAMRPPTRNLWLLTPMLAALACEGGPVEPIEALPERPHEPRLAVVQAPNFAALFADPTAAELAAVHGEWASRNTSAVNASIVHTVAATVSNTPGEVRVIEHDVAGDLHYGSVFVPAGLGAGSAPMVAYLHGGNGGLRTPGTILTSPVQTLEPLTLQFVYVLPTYRSETLEVGNTIFRTGGVLDPWDGDVDDALALLNAAAQLIPEADPARRLAWGGSRGAAVALLMGIRDPSIQGVAALAAPLTYYDAGGQFELQVRDMANGNPSRSPLMQALDQRYVQPWVNGQLPLADMRSQLIRRSIPLFAVDLPLTQYHHGEKDLIVEVRQAQVFIDSMTSLGRTPPQFEAFLYPGAGHLTNTMTGNDARIRTFVETLWPPPAPPPGDQPPVADFTWSCTAARACTFDGSNSSDDQGIASYEWLVGGNLRGTGAVIQHAFGGSLTFPLTLRVTDTIGQTNSQTQSITVP